MHFKQHCLLRMVNIIYGVRFPVFQGAESALRSMILPEHSGPTLPPLQGVSKLQPIGNASSSFSFSPTYPQRVPTFR